jgi:hypothetical protein
MSHGRKARRMRWAPTDTMALAAHRAGKLTQAELDGVLQPLQAALKALSDGVGTEMDWCQLASAVNLANAIEAQGIVKGLHEHLRAAELALQCIYRRAMPAGAWQPTALGYVEIDALNTAAELHAFQLGQLAHGEFNRALDWAEAEVRSSGGRMIKAPAGEKVQA